MAKIAKADVVKFEKVIKEANVAALKAGDEWLAKATPKFSVGNCQMLDMCGSAYVRIDDGRTKFAKFLKEKYPRGTSTILVPIHNKHKGRQEYGLAVDMAYAALEVIENAGIKKCRVWEWID